QICRMEIPVMPIRRARIVAGAADSSIPRDTLHGISSSSSLVMCGLRVRRPEDCTRTDTTTRLMTSTRYDPATACDHLRRQATTKDSSRENNAITGTIQFQTGCRYWGEFLQSTNMLPLRRAEFKSNANAPNPNQTPPGHRSIRPSRLSDSTCKVGAHIAGTTWHTTNAADAPVNKASKK